MRAGAMCSFLLLASFVTAAIGTSDLSLDDPYVGQPFGAPQCGAKHTPWGPEKCVFGDHMVLASTDPWGGQSEGPPAKVWGFAAAGEMVTISGVPGGKKITVIANSAGNWTAKIATKASLNTFNLTFSGVSQNVTIHDVMFGDTWLCSGQSNMDMSVDECLSRNETESNAVNFPEIRLKNQGTAPWTIGDSDHVRKFTATCYFTAIGMKKVIPSLAKRPMGLVRSSVGGTVIEMWMTSAALQKAGVPAANATDGEKACKGQRNSQNYDNLIAPLVPFVFKGMMWYQGEANVACNAQTDPPWYNHYYAKLFPEMITSWRQAFGVPFTTLFVQLAAYSGVDEDPAQRASDALPALREDQLAATTLSRVGTALAIDLGDDGKTPWTPKSGHHGGIHPRNKSEVGRRMALRYASLEKLLPDVVADGPVPVKFVVNATGVNIAFSKETSDGIALVPTADCAAHGRVPTGSSCCQAVTGDPAKPGKTVFGFPFDLTLSNGTIVLARASVNADAFSVELVPAFGTLEAGVAVVSVRYSWQGFPLCVLRNKQGLPSTPFVEWSDMSEVIV